MLMLNQASVFLMCLERSTLLLVWLLMTLLSERPLLIRKFELMGVVKVIKSIEFQ